MKNNWKKCKIGDVSGINQDVYSSHEDWKYVRYLDTGNITQNKIENIQYINLLVDKLPSRAKRKVKNGDIIYSTVRPNQLHYGYIKNQPENFLVSTGFAVINIDKTKADFLYVYYVLTQSENIEALQAIAEQSVSTYPSIKPSDIGNIEINLPPLTTQRQIAKILSSLDDKIELNNRINKNLEEQAMAIYKSWFVDFEPFGGKMPKDWRKGIVDDIASDIICGKTPSTKNSEYYGTDIPFITIPDMHNNVYVINTERSLSFMGANTQPQKNLPKNSVCISCIGTAGLVSLVAFDSQTNQQINAIIPKDGYSPFYIFLVMKTLSKIINKLGSSGSTITNLNKEQFRKIEVVVPSLPVMKNFHLLVSAIFKIIYSNQVENLKLTSMRDALLPKLMNGEVDVSKIKV